MEIGEANEAELGEKSWRLEHLNMYFSFESFRKGKSQVISLLLDFLMIFDF